MTLEYFIASCFIQPKIYDYVTYQSYCIMAATSDAIQLKLASEPTNPAVLLSSKVNAGLSAN